MDFRIQVSRAGVKVDGDYSSKIGVNERLEFYQIEKSDIVVDDKYV